jgi:hypothetical protein
MNQMSRLPGMAMTVYLVQMLVISAALPSTVTSAAVYSAVPHTQWPATVPSGRTPSRGQRSTLTPYRMREW